MIKTSITLFFLVILACQCSDQSETEYPVFQTGYEETNWQSIIQNYFNSFSFQMSCEDTNENYFEIAPDPKNSNNNTLHFVINNGCDYSGRVQFTVLVPDKERYHIKQKYYLSNDFNIDTLRSIYSWLNIFEFWEKHNDIWDGSISGQAKWTLTIMKSGLYKTFYWNLCGTIMQPASLERTVIWSEDNFSIPVPFGKWFELEIKVIRGEGKDGLFYVSLTTEGESKQILFSINNSTTYPGNSAPIQWFTPWKFYMNVEMVDYIKSNSGNVHIYFDDFKWYEN